MGLALTRARLSAAVPKRVAVVLSGCGVYDGSEVQESIFALNQLSKMKAQVECFAPNIPQMHVINHNKGEPEEGVSRNVLAESARICRGNVKDLASLAAKDFDAAIFPGGFGAAKNLSDLAVKGGEVTLNADVDRVIKEFHSAGKVQGFCCIAPALAAKALEGVEVTVGSDQESPSWPYAGTTGAIAAVGSKHIVKPLNEAHVDSTYKVVSSPAYMCNDAPIHEIEESVVAMVTKTMELA